jgi:hypothetical protein
MLKNNDNTMKNMDSLTAALGNAEIDHKGIIAQMNELTQQLCPSTLEDLINSTDPLKEKALTQEEQAVLTKYGWYLDHSGEDLADIKPPTNEHDLEILGKYISAELWKRHQAGEGWDMLFSPQAHPHFPCWLANHEINKVLDDAYFALMEARHPGWEEFVLSYENEEQNEMDMS